MTLYTGRGDAGQTDLFNQERVAKTAPRIEAAGTVDELNAHLGRCYPTGHEDVDDHLESIQHQLHRLQAELATPEPEAETPTIDTSHVETLEEWIDEAEADLPPLEAFILPGGSAGGSRLHLARTVCRRAERRAVAVFADDEDETAPPALAYLNRLSDLLFAMARLVNTREGFEERHPSY